MLWCLGFSDCPGDDWAKRLTNPLGIHTFHNPEDVEISVDIIFFHGLGGKSEKSWSLHDIWNFFWPAWLVKELGLKGARLSTFGYPSAILPTLIKDYSTIRDFANGFLHQGIHYGSMEAKEVPLGKVSVHVPHL